MGRHAAPGSDGSDPGSAPSSAGRRRTDGTATPWRGEPGELSDHPTAPGRSRADRRRDGLLDSGPDPVRRPQPARPQAARPVAEPRVVRPPLPPVRPVSSGPQTTMAPFQVVPAPTGDGEDTAAPPAEDLWASRSPRPVGPPQPGPAGPSAAERRSVPPRPVRPRPLPVADEPLPVSPRPVEAAAPTVDSPGRDALGPDVPVRPVRAPWDDEPAAPWSTGPAGARKLPPTQAPSRVPGSAGAAAPPYGDWTRPSRSGSSDEAVSGPSTGPGPLLEVRPVLPPAPETTAIPERNIARASDLEDDLDAPASTGEHEFAGHRDPHDGDLHDRDLLDRDFADRDLDDRDLADRDLHDRDLDDRLGDEDDRGGAVAGPPTGEDALTVTGTIGGRAALRAERQAAEAARRKSGRKGATALREDVPRRSPRRAATGLIAVAVVALGVLGVYSFASPDTRETASRAAAPTVASAPATGSAGALSDLPPLSTGPVSAASSAPASPIRLPVTVLNETDVHGLAASISGVLKNGGWPTTDVGAYGNKDVAATTVFFTQGDENQRQAALQLIGQFPQLQGPTPRFFDVPGNAAPGLVVVAAGEWKP